MTTIFSDEEANKQDTLSNEQYETFKQLTIVQL
jgi:hypothetical protein